MVKKQAALCLMLLLVFPPLVAAESSSINLTSSDNYIASPGDTVQHHIDVSYTGTAEGTKDFAQNFSNLPILIK